MDITSVTTAPPTTTTDEAPGLTCLVAMDTTMSVVHLVGELDLATAPLLRSVADGQVRTGHVDLRLDVAGLEFCDGHGVRVLTELRERLAAAGGRLVLLRPTPFLRDVAGWWGVPDLFGPDDPVAA